MNFKKYIGDRAFYKHALAIALPIMIQNGITNLVGLLDNVMVGRLGTESMSGVSIVNQFIFIFNLAVFGAISAAGIFTAQYKGKGDEEGIRYTLRLKLIITALVGFVGIVGFLIFGDGLISSFLHATESEGDLALTLAEGKRYLLIMLVGLLPYGIAQVYASTMRETGQSVVPMVSSLLAVGVNFVLNLVLIFGLCGAPALGVAGAAIATVISRFCELLVIVVWGYTHKKKYSYLVGALRSFRVPRKLLGAVVVKGMPLMANEIFWAIAMVIRNQCYSTRGLDVVAGLNISTTVVNLFQVVYMAIGSSIAIIVGNELGAGELDRAKDTDRKLMALCIFASVAMAGVMIAFSGLFPELYNTTKTAKELATFCMIVSAAVMPFASYAYSAYFTLRSGGRVFVTLLFDSVYMWTIVLPISVALAYFTPMGIHWLFVICQASEIIKTGFGFLLLRRGTWVRQLVADESLKG